MTIQDMGSFWTIVFKNQNLGGAISVWVCQDNQSYKSNLDKLSKMKHIQVVYHGVGLIK